ncbi:APH(3') family aminoglycoside O-phosphotransferase [Actinokineospora sp. 24-640]
MEIPDAVLTTVGPDATWSTDHEGRGGDGVWRTSGAAGTFFVKHGPSAALEHQRLSWLTGRVPVPEVRAWEAGFLVLADVQAPSLLSAPPPDIGTVMGTLLRRLHGLPVEECPFDSRLPVTVGRARANVDNGLVDADDLDDDHHGSTPEQLFATLVERLPATEDLVVAHGDFTPANVLLRPDRTPVLIDLAQLGVADRHRDLALAVRDLGEAGGEAVEAFTAAYGLVPDPDRLYWYRLLDEFS